MKHFNAQIHNWLLAGLVALSTCLTACTQNNSDENDVMVPMRASLSGSQERPNPVNTPATGTVTARYNRDSRELDYTVSWTRLSANPSAMHFHGPATPQEVAPPIITISGFPAATTGTVTNRTQLSAEQAAQLLSGMWYVNIHTPNNPPGEIRGQVMIGR